MPLPFALNHINLWLLDDEGGLTVVDTGVGLPPTRELWEKLFAGELTGQPVVRVLVTHFHPDHMGNAEWLTRRFGVELWCPQAEWLMAQLAWQGMGGNDSAKRLDHYRRHGVGPEQIEGFRGRGNHYRRTPVARLHRAGPCAGARLPLLSGGERADFRRPGPAEDHDERERLARPAARQSATALPRLPPALPSPARGHARAAVPRAAIPRPAPPPRLLAAAP